MTISQAFRAMYRGRVTQVELAEHLGVNQTTVSDWSTRDDGKLQEWLDYFAESEALAKRPRGWTLRQAGYVDEADTTLDMIANDPDLSDTAREQLARAYRAAVKQTAADRVATGND